MYADDIYLLSPSALGLQKLFDVCYNFSQCNDIVFNSLKSVYIVFRPKRYKLFCLTVSLHSDRLNLGSTGEESSVLTARLLMLYTLGLLDYNVIPINDSKLPMSHHVTY